MKNKLFMSFVMFIAIVGIDSMVAFAFTTTCHEQNCNNICENEVYCSEHRCSKGSCSARRISNSKYCSSHTCGKGRSGCYNGVSSANSKCSLCKEKANKSQNSGTITSKKSTVNSATKKKTTQNNTTKKKTTVSTKKKKVSMPDCDDYDSYDDFMDDWDGCMPDGSDAEDYWENW